MASLKELLAQKSAAAVTPPAAGGTVIRTAPALSPQRDAKTPQPVRQLGEATAEAVPDVPFEFASEKPSEAAKEWLLARQQVSTQLGVWMEPPPGVHAWLAVESASDPGRLILLHRLPLLSRPYRHDPF